jgi:predicted NBD/HSP70 family sugar kinase
VGLAVDRNETIVTLADLTGASRYQAKAPVGLATGDPGQVVGLLAGQVHTAVAAAPRGARVLGAGVGCRGPLDFSTGVLHRPGGLRSWDRFPLRDELATRLDGLPVYVDKDTNAAVLAVPGPGSTAYLHVADGVGAGLLLNGTVYRGARTNAGEFGHQVLQLNGPRCTCGQHGCLEALCLAALTDGDHHAAARLLGVGAANLVRLLDVDRILLGGNAVFTRPEVYRSEVTGRLTAQLPEPEWQHVTVELTPAGPSSVAAGAAELVLGQLFGSRS